MRRILITALAVAAPLLSLAVTASAQPYEDVYGLPDAEDTGARRVTPVSACLDAAGGGFLAVGTTTTTTTTGTSSDVLLVRTDATGVMIWEKTYDVGPGRQDRGRAVAEAQDGSGYVIAGSSRGEPWGTDVLLMKVGCDGEPLWRWIYHGQDGSVDEAADVVEAKTGNVGFFTQMGDILVAGRTRNDEPDAVDDALILRTRADGTLIWNRRYLTSAYGEELLALTEAEPGINDQGTGDVVAVGKWSDANLNLNQGLALRVDGNTGALGPAAPRGAWRYGATNAEGFESVAELSLAPFAKQLVMVGSTGPATTADVWAVRTTANPGVVFPPRRLYSSPGSASGLEVALDVKAVLNPVPPFERLALTGYATRPSSVPTLFPDRDAFLLQIAPISLAPIANSRELFGNGYEQGVSVAQHAGGFIIAGTSQDTSDDTSQDLYLINTDGNGETTCSRNWKVGSAETPFSVTQIYPMPTPLLSGAVPDVDALRRDTRMKVCEP